MAERVLEHEIVKSPGAEPVRWLYMLHGIFGMGRNWGSIARRVTRARPEWGAVLVDLREHGGSRGFPPPHTLEAAARDLRELAGSLGVRTDAILGHSFGGKVALTYARDYPDAVDQLWVVDSTPEARIPGGSAARMLETLRAHPGPFASRSDAVAALAVEGWPTGVAQWMATNLRPNDGEFEWALDLSAMQALLDDFFATDLWPVVESPSGRLELHFLRATRSDILTDAAVERIEAADERTGRVFLHRVEGGHWLNADNPDAVVMLLEEWLPEAVPSP